MKWWNISLFALFAALPAMGAATEILAADTVPPVSALPADSLPPDTAATVKTKRKHYGREYYERTLEKRQRRWAKLIPNQFTFQYAGSIGERGLRLALRQARFLGDRRALRLCAKIQLGVRQVHRHG